MGSRTRRDGTQHVTRLGDEERIGSGCIPAPRKVHVPGLHAERVRHRLRRLDDRRQQLRRLCGSLRRDTELRERKVHLSGLRARLLRRGLCRHRE
jgi:hypothetical protein